MNSDKPDQVMQNNAITSKNKKKSKGKSKTDAALTDVIGRSPKKSFWKSLFRFKKHHDDPGNSSTHVITVELGNNNEESKSAPNERLGSIFEETANPASLDPKTIAQDITEIQETIKRMSETSSPSMIIDKINQNYSPKGAKKPSKEDAFLGYLSDISSTSSEDEDNEENEELKESNKPEEAKKKLDEQAPLGEFCGMPNLDNNSTYTDLLADDKPNKGSSSLLKEGYSFEYSETSEISNGEIAEEKPEKVTFDNKVETKDANSIITVRPLDENDSKVVIEEVVRSAVIETNEFLINESRDYGTTSQLDEISNVTEEDIIVARIQGMVSGRNAFEEEPAAATMDSPAAAFSLPVSQMPQKQTNRAFYSIPPEDAKAEEMADPLGKAGANRFTEDSEPSTSSISKNSTCAHQDLDETLDIESIDEETELWMEELTDFPFAQTPDMVPLEDLDDDTSIDNEIFREFRLNKFFKMIQNNITMNVSIAYDPLFENEPMIQNLHAAIVEQEVRNEERNKVIRKRKMMSLLHDKQVFKDYLKEMEVKDTQTGPSTAAKTNPNTQNEENASNKLIDMNKVPRGNMNIFNEATLLNLKSTKSKLERLLVENNGLKTAAKSTYPKQYLRVYNLQTNKQNEDGLEESDNNTSMESCSMSSEDVAPVKPEAIKAKSTSFGEMEVAEKLSPSLQTKLCAYETIDRDVEQLIADLMGHVTDLKESCIKYGATVSVVPEDDAVLFMKQPDVLATVHAVLDEVLENVFTSREGAAALSAGHFNQCFSFIREFGRIDEDLTALSYRIKPVVKNYYPTENPLTLTENLQRANGYLSTVYEEMCEYNPIPVLGNDDLEANENIQFVDEANMENFEEPITEQQVPFNGDLVDFHYQTDFETELSVIHEEDEHDLDNNNNSSNNAASLNIAEHIIQFIEETVSGKRSSMRNNCEDLQDYDEHTLDVTQTPIEEDTRTSDKPAGNGEKEEKEEKKRKNQRHENLR